MAGKKRTFDPEKHCGGKILNPDRTVREDPCKNVKGFRTTHPGSGRCYRCGGQKKTGDKRVKHGLYASHLPDSSKLKNALDRVRSSGIGATDLTPDLELLRALVMNYVEEYDRLAHAVLNWNESFNPAFQTILSSTKPEDIVRAVALLKQSVNQRPKQALPDIAGGASTILDRVGRMAERIHSFTQKTTLSWEKFAGAIDRMGLILLKHLRACKELDEKQQNEIIRAIKADWEQINIPD